MACTAAACLLAGALDLLACAPGSRPIVAEVYYDAPGDDTGWEFVELFNPFGRTVSLAGLRLEAGDGAAPGRWTLHWTGGAADSIGPRARFVIGGAHVSPPPQATVTLDLQNGPDAMRVVWPDGAVEVVGWGALASPEYFCGESAPDVAAGQSLSRVPDDADLGSNALDFRAAEPSPGRANRPEVDLALLRGTLALAPETPAPGEALALSLRVLDRGALAAAAGADTLVLDGDALEAAARLVLPAIAPGETLGVALPARAGEAGRRVLRARAIAPGDAAPENDADTLFVRIGSGPLELTEIQFHPAAGEGEWVEVRNRSAATLSLAGFTFSDRADGRAHVLDSLAVEPDSLALLAQNRAALLAAIPGLDGARIARVAPWPSLNNTNAADGTADVVTLREHDGLTSDRVAYSASGVPAGASLEKAAGAWKPSGTPAGTPLSPPRAPPLGAGGFSVEPRRLSLAHPEARLAWRLPWPQAHVSAALYDLSGRNVAALFDAVGAGAGERTVRLDGAGPGIFAIVLRAREGGELLERTALVRITGTRP
jgi:hypothetical protein